MFDRQFWFAVTVTLLLLGVLTFIGCQSTSENSDAITPDLHARTKTLVVFGADARRLTTVERTAEPTLPIGPTLPLSDASSRIGHNGITFSQRRDTCTCVRCKCDASSARLTPTPVSVVVGTQKRSWVFYRGPATYVRADAFAPLALSSLPRPAYDNGRGLHWFPTTYQTRAVVDRFIPELKAMKIRWLVVLQGMDDWNMIANDYLIDQLNATGIAVVMRIDRQVGAMDWRRLGWVVARYRERGVRYFQLFNEPNVEEEWGTRESPSPEQFVAYWIQAAEVVAANGGFPGFSPMSPQSDDSDLLFFKAALEEVKSRGRFDLINMMWIAVHNYGDLTSDGFFRYRRYDAIVKSVFGGTLPIIIAEGGVADAEQMASVIVPMYRFIQNEREPYLLAFAPWLIGNAVGGGHDARWEGAAWFTGTSNQIRARNVVEQAKFQ